MKTLTTLQQDRAHKERCAQDLIDQADKDNRPMSLEETQVFDKLTSELEDIDAEIKRVQDHADRAAKLKKIRDEASLGGRQSTADNPSRPTNDPRLPAEPRHRYGALKAFKGPQAEERAYKSGQWLRANLLGDQRAARWCEDYFRNALAENDNTKGGILVPEELSQTIIDLREQYGVFRQQALVYPMASDTAIVPRRVGGVSVEFIGENPSSSPTQSNPTWNSVRLTAKKAAGLTLMSTEVAEDAIISLADWIAQEVAYAFALKEDQCGFVGDGTSTYGGIRGLGNIFTTTGGAGGAQLVGAVDAASGHDTFAEIDANDLASLMAKLPQYARANAKFYCSTVCADLVFGRLLMAAGGNTIADMEMGYRPRWAGYPIVISQVLPTSTGDLSDVPMFYFGDLRLAATLGTRREVRVVPSAHRYMELDQLAFFFTERFDIVVHDVGDTTTGSAGPIVAMVGE